jgi:hypothetical protein
MTLPWSCSSTVIPAVPQQVAAGSVKGHEGRVPAAKAERPLLVRSGDLRRGARQWARRAVSGYSLVPNRTSGFDPIAAVV